MFFQFGDAAAWEWASLNQYSSSGTMVVDTDATKDEGREAQNMP